MRIEIEIDDQHAAAVAGWLTEQGTRIADRATVLPGHTMGSTSAVLKLLGDVVDGVARGFGVAEPEPADGPDRVLAPHLRSGGDVTDA